MITPFSTVYAQNRCNGFHSAYCFSSDLRIMIFYILRNKPAQHQANQYCTYFLRGEVCLICYALKIFRLKFQNTIHQIFFALKCNVCFFCACMIFFLNFKTFQDLICGEKNAGSLVDQAVASGTECISGSARQHHNISALFQCLICCDE